MIPDASLAMPPQLVERALCAEVDPGLFFTESKGQAPWTAKRVCAACEVRVQCLEWALSFANEDDLYGIYGGHDPATRRKLRKQRKLAQKEAS
jgi:WhiB family redox-sensing transcriptional regulator